MSNKPMPVHVECIHLPPFSHWRPEMKAFSTCTDMTRKQEEQTGEEGLMDVRYKDNIAGVKPEMGGKQSFEHISKIKKGENVIF